MFVSKEVKRFGWSGVNISTASLPALTAVFGRQTPAKPENTLQLWRTLNTQRRGGGKNFGLCPPFPYPPQNGQNKKSTEQTVLRFTNSPAVALLLDDLLAVPLPVAGHVLSPLPRHPALAVILHVALHTRH